MLTLMNLTFIVLCESVGSSDGGETLQVELLLLIDFGPLASPAALHAKFIKRKTNLINAALD